MMQYLDDLITRFAYKCTEVSPTIDLTADSDQITVDSTIITVDSTLYTADEN